MLEYLRTLRYVILGRVRTQRATRCEWVAGETLKTAILPFLVTGWSYSSAVHRRSPSLLVEVFPLKKKARGD